MSKKKNKKSLIKRTADGLPEVRVYLKPIKKKKIKGCTNCKFLVHDGWLCGKVFPPKKPPDSIYNKGCRKKKAIKIYF